jgi:Putative zinc-finger
MSHLDEGTLHALLDGELELNEVKEIQAHLGSCAACGSRLREVRDFLQESDRLVSAVQFPGELRPPPGVGRSEAAPAPAAAFRDRGRAGRAEPDTAPPVILLPENPDFDVRSSRWGKALRWAAAFALVVGAGYLGTRMRQGGAPPIAELVSKTIYPASSTADSAPVASQQELADSQSADQSAKPSTPAAPPARAARSNATPPKSVASSKQAAPRPQALAVRDEAVEEAKDTAEPAANEDSLTAPTPEEEESFDREAASAAMERLDRQRRMERAKSATALLDAERREREVAGRAAGAARPAGAAAAEPPVALVPAPPLAPRTLEQRSQIYLRIGLDEAARQLGRPVHVIEGLSPAFMGLAQGRISPGADSTRPVVRVVYQDNQGRMIVLDQQRIRQGQTPAEGDSGWNYGEIRLSLFGEVGPEVLKNLRPRVR